MFLALFSAAAEVPPVGGFNPTMLIMLLGMLALLFWMQSRAKKQAAQRDAFRSQLMVGQRVMTQGGLVGTIVGINDATDTVILDSAGSRCEYMRAGIAKTLDDAVPAIDAVPALADGVPAGSVITPNPQYGANVITPAEAVATGAVPVATPAVPVATPAVNPVAPAGGGFLANALGNLANATAPGQQVSDADLAELDAIAGEYHSADSGLASPIIVTEEEIITEEER